MNYDTLRLEVEALVRQQGEAPLDVPCEVLAAQQTEKCPCCGGEPFMLLRFPDVEAYMGTEERWHPVCQSAYQEHLDNAQDTNDHEMEKFGGAYGLVTWQERRVRDLSGNPNERSEGDCSGEPGAVISATPSTIDIQRELLLIAHCGCDSDPKRATIREEIQKLP